MKLTAKELIKLLIAKEGITQKELTAILNEKTSKKYSPDGFSRKINKGTITFNETIDIVDILGYKLNIEQKNVN